MKKIIILCLIAILLTGCTNTETYSADKLIRAEKDIVATPTTTPEPTPTPEPEEPNPFEKMTTYSEGQYKIGTDMPSGEYILFSTSGNGYFSVTTDANGDDIVFNDNFDVNSIVTVHDGEFLKLSRAFAVSTVDFYSEYTIVTDSPGVMLKVGKDLYAGEYKIKATSDSGYYCIYADSRHNDIVSNDNFSGSRYIEVADGQYLVLSRCVIE